MAKHGHPDKLAVVIEPEADPSRGVGSERVMGRNEGLCFAIVLDRRDLILRGADYFIRRANKLPGDDASAGSCSTFVCLADNHASRRVNR